MTKTIETRREGRIAKGKTLTSTGIRVGRAGSKVLPKPNKTTHLSDKSTSRMSNDVKKLNKKVLQYINNL